MLLKELIKYLENEDPKLVVPMGFNEPHSYRGFYGDLAFEPAGNVTVGEMLKLAKEALGRTYSGWKGGQFKMNGFTDVHLAEWGHTGEGIGIILLNYMLGKYKEAKE